MSKDIIVKEAIKEGLKEVIIRTGDAIVLHNPNPVIIKGNIDAPSRFIEGRMSDFESSKRHCLVSKTDGTIELIINEQSTTDLYKVIGKIEVAKKFISLSINTDKGYSPEELANKFKLLRAIFVSNLEHAKICSTLRNLKAKINRDIEELNDQKGNVTSNFKQTVESNMPDSIKLNIPLLEGENDVEIEVNVTLQANGSSEIKCYLESVDAAELIETQFKNRVSEEIDKIKDWVTIIEH